MKQQLHPHPALQRTAVATGNGSFFSFAKRIFTVAVFLASVLTGELRAQYFQDTYGTPVMQELKSGINTRVTPGHIMTGPNRNTQTTLSSVVVTRTNVNGIPVFNNNYTLMDQSWNPESARPVKIIELPNGQTAVFGHCAQTIGGMPTRFFYLLLNANGTVAVAEDIMFSTPPLWLEATSMCYSASTGNIIVCGKFFNNQTIATPILMSIRPAGPINWVKMYTAPQGIPWVPLDLVESPYGGTPGNRDIAVVGAISLRPTNGDACFFTVSALNGMPVSQIMVYGTEDVEEFRSIAIANNPVGSGPGFVMAGYAGGAANTAWAIKTNPGGTVVDWSTRLGLSQPGAWTGVANDIIERNNNGVYEYYVGGCSNRPPDDAIVFKLNANGIPFTGGQFTYFNTGDEWALELDQDATGLSIYGSTDPSSIITGNPDFYLVRAYFNGVTACNYDTSSPPYQPGPVLLGVHPPLPSDNPWNIHLLNTSITGLQYNVICWQQSIGAGSNSRLAQEVTEQPALRANVFPNPVSRDNATVQLAFEQPAAGGEATIELRNLLGQLCRQQTITVPQGATQLPVELGSGLQQGMYHLIIRYEGKEEDFRLSVQ